MKLQPYRAEPNATAGTTSATRACKTDSRAPLRVRVCSSWDELELLRAEWDNLVTSSGSSIFSTFEWLSAWWHSYAATKELVVLLFLAGDDEVAGIAPLYWDTRNSFLGRTLRVLRFVGDGSGDSDNLDVLIRPGHEALCAESFMSWLRPCEWDMCVLATLPENSPFHQSLARCLRFARWPVLETLSPHFSVSLPGTWERYLQNLGSEFRPLLSRYPRRLRKKHQVQIYRSTSEDLGKTLPKLFSLHQQRWEAQGRTGAFRKPARRQFYQQVSRTFSQRGWLEFWLMDLDGSTVAAQFCFRLRDTVYLLQEGFDPKYANEKVGYALRAATLEHFIGARAREYDFLGGADPYKHRFGAAETSYRTIAFARPSTLGSLQLALDRFSSNSRQWTRANLPQPVVHFLRRVLRKVRNERA